MKKLAEKEYWDSIYKMMPSRDGRNISEFKNWIKNLTKDYSNFLMWDVIIQRYLPKNKDLKIIEIGCAPGKYLINFNKKFAYQPYGVEYSEKGVQITKENFTKAGLDPQNIIQRDFFDTTFESEYKDKFDLVFSRGFIEHYDDVKSVVDKHLSLIKSGGLILISIPNLQGLNKIFGKALNIDSYNLHNVSIMNLKTFGSLFSDQEVERIFCDYVGLFSFGLFNTNKKWKYHLHRILLLIQRPFDLLLRVMFPSGHLKSRNSSPYLLFIGRKK